MFRQIARFNLSVCLNVFVQCALFGYVRKQPKHDQANLENLLESNPTMIRTFPEELKTMPAQAVASLVKLETITEVSELESEESNATALVDAEDSDEEELDNMNLMVTDLVVDVENSEEEVQLTQHKKASSRRSLENDGGRVRRREEAGARVGGGGER